MEGPTPEIEVSVATANTGDNNNDNEPAEEKRLGKKPPPRIPPIGERTVDYALRVLKEKGHGMTIEKLAPAMLEAGWPSTSPTEEKRNRSVEVALYRHKDELVRNNGVWEMVAEREN